MLGAPPKILTEHISYIFTIGNISIIAYCQVRVQMLLELNLNLNINLTVKNKTGAHPFIKPST